MYPGPPAKESIELLLASAVPSDHGSHANPRSMDLGGPPPATSGSALCEFATRNQSLTRALVISVGLGVGNRVDLTDRDGPERTRAAGQARDRCQIDNAVEVTGLEPVTSSLRTKRSTGLSYTPEGRSGYQSPRAGLLGRSGTGASCWGSRSRRGQGWLPLTVWSKRWRTIAFVTSPRVRSSTARNASVVRRKPPVTPSG